MTHGSASDRVYLFLHLFGPYISTKIVTGIFCSFVYVHTEVYFLFHEGKTRAVIVLLRNRFDCMETYSIMLSLLWKIYQRSDFGSSLVCSGLPTHENALNWRHVSVWLQSAQVWKCVPDTTVLRKTDLKISLSLLGTPEQTMYPVCQSSK